PASVPPPGRPDHAGAAADAGADRHAAARAAPEHPHPEGADPEDRGGALRSKGEQRGGTRRSRLAAVPLPLLTLSQFCVAWKMPAQQSPQDGFTIVKCLFVSVY
ncbi:hypothetical protein ANANG_G00056150, partial [Anguilla anguilla]